MEIKVIYWKDRYGNSVQEDDPGCVRKEHILKGGKSYIAGLICCPYGWDAEYGDTILSVYIKEISSSGVFLGWSKLKGEELKKKYLYPILAPDDDAFFQDTQLVVTYEDENIYIKQADKQFMEGLKWYEKMVDHDIDFVTVFDLGKATDRDIDFVSVHDLRKCH